MECGLRLLLTPVPRAGLEEQLGCSRPQRVYGFRFQAPGKFGPTPSGPSCIRAGDIRTIRKGDEGELSPWSWAPQEGKWAVVSVSGGNIEAMR